MHQRAFADFCETLRDLSDEPSPVNVQRYLAASRMLELAAPKKRPARRSRRTSAKTRASASTTRPAAAST